MFLFLKVQAIQMDDHQVSILVPKIKIRLRLHLHLILQLPISQCLSLVSFE